MRLIATADNGDDLWLGIKGIDVNKVKKETLAPYTATGVQLENLNATYNSTKELMIDGNPSTITYLKDPNGDRIAAGAAVIVDLGSSKPIGEVTITGHASSPNDRPSQGVVEVSDDKATWTKLGDLSDDVTSTVSGNVTGRYVRIRNTAAKNVWWRVAEITVTPPETAVRSSRCTRTRRSTGTPPHWAPIRRSCSTNRTRCLTAASTPDSICWRSVI